MSDVPTPRRPAAAFTFYCYSDRHRQILAPPGRSPEEAWDRAVAFVRNSYDPEHPWCVGDGDLKGFFGLDREPTREELEAAVLEDLEHYSILLQVSAPSEAAALAWFAQGDVDREVVLDEWRAGFEGEPEVRH